MLQTFIATIVVLVTAEFLPKQYLEYPNYNANIFTIPIWLLFVILRPAAIVMFKFQIFTKYVLNQKKMMVTILERMI